MLITNGGKVINLDLNNSLLITIRMTREIEIFLEKVILFIAKTQVM